MRARSRLGAVLVSGLAVCGLISAPALASGPAEHAEEDVTGDFIECDTTTYTIESGTIRFTFHESQSRSGNTSFTGTITPQHVVATDEEGNLYSVRGAFWFGGTTNAQRGSEQQTFTGKLQIVAAGSGTVDSVNMTFHVNLVDGEVTNIKDFDFGTCAEPS